MSPAYVVDTGVVLRWFVPQVGYEHAREVRDAFRAGPVELAPPDFARVELAEVLLPSAGSRPAGSTGPGSCRACGSSTTPASAWSPWTPAAWWGRPP